MASGFFAPRLSGEQSVSRNVVRLTVLEQATRWLLR